MSTPTERERIEYFKSVVVGSCNGEIHFQGTNGEEAIRIEGERVSRRENQQFVTIDLGEAFRIWLESFKRS